MFTVIGHYEYEGNTYDDTLGTFETKEEAEELISKRKSAVIDAYNWYTVE